MENYDLYKQLSAPFMYAIYVVVLITTVKNPHSRRVGELKRDKSIQ